MQPINHITLPAMSGADFAGFLNVLRALAAAGWSPDSSEARHAVRMALASNLLSDSV